MATHAIKYICLQRYGSVLQADTDGVARFVTGRSPSSVLERVPLGYHRIAFRNFAGDFLAVDHSSGAIRFWNTGGIGGWETFTEVEDASSDFSFMQSNPDGRSLFLFTWRDKPSEGFGGSFGSTGGWPEIWYGASAIDESTMFSYEVPNVAFLPNGRNEEIPENSGDLPVTRDDIVSGLEGLETRTSAGAEPVTKAKIVTPLSPGKLRTRLDGD